MPLYFRCSECDGILPSSSGKIDDDGDICALVHPCHGCVLLKARQAVENSVGAPPKPEATTDDTEATDHREARMVHLDRKVRDLAFYVDQNINQRLKAAESTLADAEDALEALETKVRTWIHTEGDGHPSFRSLLDRRLMEIEEKLRAREAKS